MNPANLQRVERRLRADPGLRVIQIEPDDDNAMQQLAVLQEGVLLYDAAAADPQVIQAIHTLHPRMALMGLDGAAGREVVLLGRVYPQTVMAALGQVLSVLPPEKPGIASA